MLRFSFVPGKEITISQMRVALLNAIVARQRGESCLVRIEDIGIDDRTKGQEQDTLALLKKFAIEESQRFYQSDTLGRYQRFALSLLEQKKAFACICSSEANSPACCTGTCFREQEKVAREIKAAQLPFVICVQKPETPIVFTDKIYGEIYTEPSAVGSSVILDSGGIPSTDFATACDDMLSNITVVIRSKEALEHTSREIYLKQMLGYTVAAEYAHLPEILSGNKEETGASSGTATIRALLEEGFLPDAIINYLLSVGFTPPQRRFTLPDAIQWFDLEQLSDTVEHFDLDRLQALNREHLAAMDDKALSRLFGFADADIGKLAKCYLDDTTTINVLEQKIKTLFSPKRCHGAQAETIRSLAGLIQEAPMYETFDQFKQYLLNQSGLSEASLLGPLQYLMTGERVARPALEEIYPLIKPYITEIARCTP